MSTLYVVIKSLLAYMQGQREVHVRGEKKKKDLNSHKVCNSYFSGKSYRCQSKRFLKKIISLYLKKWFVS